MNYFTPTIILLMLTLIGIIGKNLTFILANLFLLIVQISSMKTFFPWIEKNFLTIGVLFLTIGTLAPIASGKISSENIINTLFSLKSGLAIIIGILVSLLGSRGLLLISNYPITTTGLIIGTIIGVMMFGGIPVGPLIAAGVLSFLINKN